MTAWQSFACDVNGTSYTIPRGTALLGNTRSLHACELANNQHLRRDDPLVTETLSSSASSRSKRARGTAKTTTKPPTPIKIWRNKNAKSTDTRAGSDDQDPRRPIEAEGTARKCHVLQGKHRCRIVDGDVAEDASHRKRWISVGGVASVVTIAVTLWNVPAVHDPIAGNDELESVVTQLDGSLGYAANARERMAAVNVEVNHCRMRPTKAAERVEILVTERRKRLLDDIEEMGDPTNEQAQTLVAQFRTAIARSAEADESYVAWLQSWDANYNEIKANGCAGIPFSRGLAWDAFADDDRAAGEAKSAFLHSYNPIAKKYEQRGDWEKTDF